jgi:hypothetical protein
MEINTSLWLTCRGANLLGAVTEPNPDKRHYRQLGIVEKPVDEKPTYRDLALSLKGMIQCSYAIARRVQMPLFAVGLYQMRTSESGLEVAMIRGT